MPFDLFFNFFVYLLYSIFYILYSIFGSYSQKRSSGFGSSSISSCEFRVNRIKSSVISSKLNALAFTDTFSWNESLESTLGMLYVRSA